LAERRPVVPFTAAVLQLISLNRMYTHHSGPPLDQAVVDTFAKAIAQSGGRLDARFPLAAIQLSDDARRLLNTGDKDYFVLDGEHRVKAAEQENVDSAYVNVTSFVGGFDAQARMRLVDWTQVRLRAAEIDIVRKSALTSLRYNMDKLLWFSRTFGGNTTQALEQEALTASTALCIRAKHHAQRKLDASAAHNLVLDFCEFAGIAEESPRYSYLKKAVSLFALHPGVLHEVLRRDELVFANKPPPWKLLMLSTFVAAPPQASLNFLARFLPDQHIPVVKMLRIWTSHHTSRALRLTSLAPATNTELVESERTVPDPPWEENWVEMPEEQSDIDKIATRGRLRRARQLEIEERRRAEASVEPEQTGAEASEEQGTAAVAAAAKVTPVVATYRSPTPYLLKRLGAAGVTGSSTLVREGGGGGGGGGVL